MRRFFEIFGESLFGLCEVHTRFRGGVHLVPSYLRFHCCDSQLLSAGGLKVDLVLDTFGRLPAAALLQPAVVAACMALPSIAGCRYETC